MSLCTSTQVSLRIPDDLLASLLEFANRGGISYKFSAALLECLRVGLEQERRRVNLKPASVRPIPEQARVSAEEIRMLCDAVGRPDAQIAAAIRVTPPTLYHYRKKGAGDHVAAALRRLAQTVESRERGTELIHRILAQPGYSKAQLAEALGVSLNTLYRYLKFGVQDAAVPKLQSLADRIAPMPPPRTNTRPAPSPDPAQGGTSGSPAGETAVSPSAAPAPGSLDS